MRILTGLFRLVDAGLVGDVFFAVVRRNELPRGLDHIVVDADRVRTHVGNEADVALVPSYAADWAPRSPVAGQADVLVFPDLNTGNICCKMLEHVAGATVLGPLLQGLAKPVMDLSRASTVDTIVDTIVICCCDA